MLLISFFLLGSWLCHATKVVNEVEMEKHKEFAKRLVKLAQVLLQLDEQPPADSAVDIPMGTKEVAMGDAIGGAGEGALGGGSRGGLKIGQQIRWGKNQKVTLEMSSKGVLCASKHAKESERQILEQLKGLENVSQLEEVKDGRILIKFINGVELEQIRKMFAIRGKTMGSEYVAAFMRQLLEILKNIHEKKVVHLDAWTGNMMLSEDDGRLKLIDFDLAHDIKEGEQEIRDHTHLSFGAPDSHSGVKTDVWYVGMTTLHLLMGGFGHLKIMDSDLIDRHIPLRFPEGPIREFILACLKMSISQRATVADLLEHNFIKSSMVNDKQLASKVREWIAFYRESKDKEVPALRGNVKMYEIFLRQMENPIPKILIAKLLPQETKSGASPKKIDITQIEVNISRENNLTKVTLIPEHQELLKYAENKRAFYDFFARDNLIRVSDINTAIQNQGESESEISALWDRVLGTRKI